MAIRNIPDGDTNYGADLRAVIARVNDIGDTAGAVIPVARVGSNSGGTTNFLRADGTFAAPPGSGTNIYAVSVTSDGTTDVSATIQAVLDGLTSAGHSNEVIVEGTTKGAIYLNGKVRISTSNTRVRFRNPLVLGTGIDPDGFGGLSVKGTSNGSTTVSSGATRGSSQIVVASTSGISIGQLVQISDNDTSGGGSSGYKTELAEVVDIAGTTLYLDHPLYQAYTGTVTLQYLTAVTNSGFEDISATFTGQQSAAFLFPVKFQWARYCYLKNANFRGNKANSWSRECVNLRWAYRCHINSASVSFGWDYAVGSTYCYAFSADGVTECTWTDCWATNTRHSFSLDKGAAGCSFVNCTATNVLASGFDLHGNWCTDIRYVGCHADSSVTYSANDGQRVGFLSGNTTFINGVANVTYTGCTARNFGPYTTATSGSGDGAGFGVVDGCKNITFQGCRVIDSEMGVYILSQIGTPITNVGVYDCEFININSTATANIPIYINAGIAPQDVLGVVVDGCRFIGGGSMAALRVYGQSGNTLSDIVITNCTWNRSTLASGVHALDVRYVDNLVITGNTFNRTNRGVALLNCVDAAVVGNTFVKLGNATSAKDTILDSGGNTNMVFADNRIVGYQPTGWGTAITSTGAYVDFTPTKATYATSGRPAADVVRVGGAIWDTTLGRPVWSDGTNYLDPLAVTPIDTVSGTTYTLAATDAGRLKEFTNSGAVTVTLPSDTTAAIPVGTTIPLRQFGTGQVTTVAGSGASVVGANGLKTASQYSTIVAEKRAANAWLISGEATS